MWWRSDRLGPRSASPRSRRGSQRRSAGGRGTCLARGARGGTWKLAKCGAGWFGAPPMFGEMRVDCDIFWPISICEVLHKKGQERGEYWVLVRFQASTWGRCQHEMTKSRNLVVADQFNNVPYCWSKVGKPRPKKTEHGDHWPTDLFKMQPEQCKSDSNNLSLAMSNPAPVVDW